MSDDSCRDRLIDELKRNSDTSLSAYNFNNRFDLSLSFFSVLASIAATGLAGASPSHHWLIALVAALPATSTTIQKIVDFRSRADFHYRFSRKIRALATELEYESAPDVNDFAHRYANLELEMGKMWSLSAHLVGDTSSEHEVGKRTHRRSNKPVPIVAAAGTKAPAAA